MAEAVGSHFGVSQKYKRDVGGCRESLFNAGVSSTQVVWVQYVGSHFLMLVFILLMCAISVPASPSSERPVQYPSLVMEWKF